VLTTSQDGLVRIWDPEAARPVHELDGGGEVMYAGLSADGSRLLALAAERSASPNGTLRVWDATSGRRTRDIAIPSPDGRADISPDGQLVAVAEGGRIGLYDVTTGTRVSQVGPTGIAVGGLQFTNDGRQLLASDYDGSLRVWDVAAGRYVLTGQAVSRIAGVTYDATEELIVSAEIDGGIALWDAASGRQLTRFVGHTGAVTAAMFSPDGEIVFSASEDGTARWWTVPRNRLSREQLDRFTNCVVPLHLAPSGPVPGAGGPVDSRACASYQGATQTP
jgi:WD40 repeat protein